MQPPFYAGLLRCGDDFPAVVVTAFRTNVVRHFRLVALRAGDEAGGFELPVRATPVAACLRGFALWYCHGFHLRDSRILRFVRSMQGWLMLMDDSLGCSSSDILGYSISFFACVQAFFPLAGRFPSIATDEVGNRAAYGLCRCGRHGARILRDRRSRRKRRACGGGRRLHGLSLGCGCRIPRGRWRHAGDIMVGEALLDRTVAESHAGIDRRERWNALPACRLRGSTRCGGRLRHAGSI